MDAGTRGDSLAPMVRPRIGLPQLEPLLEALERSATALADAFCGPRAKSLALGCLLAMGCGPGARVEIEGVVRDGRTGAPIANAQIQSDDGASAQTDEDGRFAIDVEQSAERVLTASAPGRCPASQTIDARPGADSTQVTLHLHDAIAIDAESHIQVGFDQEVRVEARVRCEPDAPIEWTQVSGPELGEERLQIEDDGLVAVVHTHTLEEQVSLEDRFGIVPLDRDQRGDYRLEARGTFGGHEVAVQARVLAAPTAAGVYQVPTGSDVYFNGGDADSHTWVLDTRPDESETVMEDASSRVAHLRPDRFGTYNIVHRPTGMQVSLQAGPYEDVPRDCGRSNCHQAEDDGWADTAHARTFRRGVTGELGADFDERCWSCHATGVEQGIDNGGLHRTADRAGWDQPEPDASVWEDAPRLVRRNGNVWCSACHGPGRIVPPQFHWQYGAKYQVGVCARCHDVDDSDPDANHRSPHVDEWRLSPMSRFTRALDDEDPALRAECARCHSAQGFIEWRRRDARVAPDPVTVSPISCPTCHDAHDATRPRGLRIYDTTDPLASTTVDRMGAGAVCATCHRTEPSDADDVAPHAPQTNVLLGLGSTLFTSGEPSGHRVIADTCGRCHMTRPGEDDPMRERAGGHTFSVRARSGSPDLSAAACAPCHGEVEPEAIGVRDWDGDGEEGPLAREHDRALLAVSESFTAAVAALAIDDGCGHVADGVRELDARLHLVDGQDRLLGDCDGDGAFAETETAFTTSQLPPALRRAAYDLALLRADGSRGVHNPEFTFGVLGALREQLQ